MLKEYEVHTVKNLKFFFKRELNPLTKQMEIHTWIRHLITPEEVIAAFFNHSCKINNTSKFRWEIYSEHDKLAVWYFIKKDEVRIITAFRN